VIKLTQPGLIQKILKATGMEHCNPRKTPTNTSRPLGTDKDGKPPRERWSYASVVGMMMYLASNSRPEIAFAVHQAARFTHCTRASHKDAVLWICTYLKGTQEDGLLL